MLRLTRHARLLSRDVGRSYAAWQDPHMRIYVVRATGLRFDSGALGVLGPRGPRAGHINIQLDGMLLSRRWELEQTIAARSLAVDPRIYWNERWIGPAFRVLVIEWDREYGPVPAEFSQGNISVRDHARLSAIADVIERAPEPRAVASAVEQLDALLCANGVRIDGLEALRRSVASERDAVTARWLSALRSALHTQPSWVDAVQSTGRSERQLRRDVAALSARLGLNADGLRTLLVRERVLSAALLLSARGASVTEVARSVGFGTARALGLALERAGLPSASALSAAGRD